MTAPGPDHSAPTPGAVEVDPARATVRFIAAVTGGEPDEVNDVLLPGCFRTSLLRRTPKVCLSHDWSKPIGRIVSIKELMPGDRALPRTTADGQPWPRECGALVAEARFNTAIPAGRDTYEMIKFLGDEAAFSIGYRAVDPRWRNGVRELPKVDLYEISAVLHGAHRHARQLAGAVEAKSLATRVLEYKSAPTTPGEYRDTAALERVLAGGSGDPARDRVLFCDCCGRPAGLTEGRVPADLAFICAACVDAAKLIELAATEDEGAELYYGDAVLDETPFEVGPDAEIAPISAAEQRRRGAWRP